VVKIIDFKEVRKKDKEIETLKILIEKKDNTIVSLQKQLDNKCVEMIHLRKQHYKLRKEEDTFMDDFKNAVRTLNTVLDSVIIKLQSTKQLNETQFSIDKISELITKKGERR
jgi:uncharacterized protein YoxC|tara:strand:+ start:59 stop:394 length:336 start_codon:yes stop_codon:yes gene_type:complete